VSKVRTKRYAFVCQFLSGNFCFCLLLFVKKGEKEFGNENGHSGAETSHSIDKIKVRTSIVAESSMHKIAV
jgi:hypothetical protein